MNNATIYRKTLPISLMRLLLSAIGLILLLGLPVAAFLLSQGGGETVCATVTVIGFILGVIACILLSRYANYMLKAGQIAMISKGLTEGELPEQIVKAGSEAVKQRFLAANVFFALDSAIKLITRQITNGVDFLTGALGKLGGDDAKGVLGVIGGLISAFISIMLEYVNYCCLGWVFLNKDQNAFKSTCDGAVIYFQNWKTLLKNAGKVFGITLLSLVVIGVPLALLFMALFGQTSGLSQLAAALAEAMETDTSTVLWVIAAFVALMCWSILHSAFIKPYILVSVLRKYIEAGRQTPPKVDVYEKLCGLSARFRKLFEKAEEPSAPDAATEA